ncbi:hypothetical protein QJS10_CPB17g02418 [Acorus calamus]|uniref:RING-type domain-containing protein n=1 Tax=Acorus calamus TaxID=4465 RepID=A0AAV9CRK3_ACOCL|nr:hypothetical protein QJS10_CPB17g02418 [Acorus calamus]
MASHTPPQKMTKEICHPSHNRRSRTKSSSNRNTYSSNNTILMAPICDGEWNERVVGSSSTTIFICGLCSELLTRRPPGDIANVFAEDDLPIVAVLSCGHAYHGHCLEQRTSHADRHDPPCPLCRVI